jgi:hypothetical protein
MSEINRRPSYEPPQARNLSAATVNGQGPEGMCISGTGLTFQVCTPLGATPVGGACSPVGVSPTYGYCDFGNIAVEGCLTGTRHF